MTPLLDRLKSESFLVPTVGFLLFLAVYLIIFSFGGNKYYSVERMLTQWDAQHYLSIAERGYEMFPCSYGDGYICGNIGWFPFYPLLAALIALVIPATNWVMLIISWLSFYFALLLIYKLASDRYGEKAALMSVLTVLVFPASFYYLSAFPYALYLLLALLVYYLIDKKRNGLIILPSFLLGITYPSGSLIILPLIYFMIKNRESLNSTEKNKFIGAIIAPAVALILYGLYYQIAFGDFFLYLKFQSQSYYSHQMNFPLLVIYDSLRNLELSDPVNISLIFITVGMLLFYNKKLPVAFQIFMGAILLFTPTMGTTVCYYRHIVIAFPLYIMLGMAIESNWKKYLLPLYLITAVILNWLIFIPAYQHGSLM